jgi:hypothetical protein
MARGAKVQVRASGIVLHEGGAAVFDEADGGREIDR